MECKVSELVKRGHDQAAELKSSGGALDDQETADDLSAAEYKVRVDGKIVIEPKEDIKERLGRSPGKGDALLLTFAFPVTKRIRIPGQENQQGKALTDYDPYA